MTLAFLDIGGFEFILILLWLVLIIALGKYGKKTALGYYGSILLAIFTTPLVAFIVIIILRNK
jgi:hypothetical protein